MRGKGLSSPSARLRQPTLKHAEVATAPARAGGLERARVKRTLRCSCTAPAPPGSGYPLTGGASGCRACQGPREAAAVPVTSAARATGGDSGRPCGK